MSARRVRLVEVLLTWLVVLLLIRLVVAFLGGMLWELPLALVPVLFMWGPVWVLQARGEDPDRYPLALPPLRDRAWRDALVWGGGLALAVTVPFTALYHLWHTAWFPEILSRLCDEGVRATCGAARRAATFGPSWSVHPELLKLVGYHLFFVALPEELFYRGYVQSRLDDVWSPRWRFAGATVGPALLVTSVIFAAGHSLVVFQWWHFAIFFPSLAFGWLRARTGHVLAGALFHAWANIWVALLDHAWGVAPG